MPRIPVLNPDARRSLLPAGALALVLVLGFGLRAFATLAPGCIAGDDGAYYFVQVRGLLRGEGLPFPDFPLLFHVLAGIARALSAFMDQREAIVAAVRWTDTLVPLLLAVPVYLLSQDFGRGKPARAAFAILLAGLLAVASGNALVMAGGMIKNGAALPFSLFYIHFLHRGMQERTPRLLLLATLFFLVSSLIHISALALNAAFTVLLVLAGLRPGWRALAILAVPGLAIAFIPLIDPNRGARLLGLIGHPATAFSASAGSALEQPAVWLGNALGLLGLHGLWRLRAELGPETRVFVGAAAFTTLALSFPFLRPDLLERLALVSFVPGLVLAAFLACRLPFGPALLAPLLAVSMLHGLLAVKTLAVTGLVLPALEDLERLKGAMPRGRSIVMVRPGLEWWAAWTLDTRFSNWAGGALADRDAYDAMLLLEEIRHDAFGRAPAVHGDFPGAFLKDGERLRKETVVPLRTGDYFQLSRVSPGPTGP